MAKKKQESNQLEQRMLDLENQLKRALADYRNLEKRVAEGRSELTRWGTRELISKLLPVLDHLEQVLSGAGESERQSGWFKGAEMAARQFYQVLQAEGLEEVASDGGFDPNLHEAVDTREPSSAEASEGKGDNSILEVVRKGYTLNGKVLRPAQVVVGKGNPPSMEETRNEPGGETQSDFYIPPEEKGEES